MLELLVLELHGALEPVLAVQVHHDAALVEALVALGEVRLYHKAEELLLCLHLQHGSIVVPEMVVRPLPEVSVRGSGDGDDTVVDLAGSRLPGPLELFQIDLPAIGKRLGHAVGEFSVRCLLSGTAASGCAKAEPKAKEFRDVGHMVSSNS